MLKTFIVQYRIDNGALQSFPNVRAKNAANAIGQAAKWLTDIDGTLDIIATPETLES